MTPMFSHFLKYFHEIDASKEIPPGVDRDDFSFFTVDCDYCVWRWSFVFVIVESILMGIGGAVEVTVSEKAVCQSCSTWVR